MGDNLDSADPAPDSREPVIACCWLPGFALRVIAHTRVDLTEPVALASEHEAHPLVLDCSEAAQAHGVEPGMPISRAMGCCAQLQVLSCDVAGVEAAAEQFVQRLEAHGAAVQPLEPGRACFDAAPLARMYGGLPGVFERIIGAFRGGIVRIGAGPNPFVAWVATRHAPPGGWLRVPTGQARSTLARMPLTLLPADVERIRLLHALGLETLGDVAAIDVHQIADRFGAEGVRLHALARGEDAAKLQPRAAIEPVIAHLVFPEPVANTQTLDSAVQMLAKQLSAHPRCVLHAPRAVIVTCTLTAGGTFHARRVLRAPTIDPLRLALAIQPSLAQVPAAVERIELALDGFEPRDADQRTLLDETARGGDGASALGDERVQRGMRHVQEALGEDSLLQVLEVEPWSRVPERHAVLVPRHSAAARSAKPDGADVGRGVWR